MSSVAKIVEKMKNQPYGIRLEEAEKVLHYHGYILDRQTGSHRQYITKSGGRFTLPAKSPLKKVYVAAILERIGE